MGVKPPATPLQIQYYSFWYPGCKRTKRHRAMLARIASTWTHMAITAALGDRHGSLAAKACLANSKTDCAK